MLVTYRRVTLFNFTISLVLLSIALVASNYFGYNETKVLSIFYIVSTCIFSLSSLRVWALAKYGVLEEDKPVHQLTPFHRKVYIEPKQVHEVLTTGLCFEYLKVLLVVIISSFYLVFSAKYPVLDSDFVKYLSIGSVVLFLVDNLYSYVNYRYYVIRDY